MVKIELERGKMLTCVSLTAELELAPEDPPPAPGMVASMVARSVD